MRQRPFKPGFDHTVEASPESVSREIEACIASGGPCIGQSVQSHLMLTVAEDERHMWSPFLHLEVVPHRSEADSDAPRRAYVRGFFTPRPSLWSAFLFSYLACATLSFFAAVWGASQWMIGESPSALWLSGLFALGGIGLWIVSSIGQRLAAVQMRELQATVEATLARAGDVA